VAPDDPNTFYFTVTASSPFPAFVYSSVMYRTRDAGQTWVALPIDDDAWASEPVIGRQGRLLIVQNGNLYRSTDYGDSWTTIADWDRYDWQIVGSLSNPSVLYAHQLYDGKSVMQSRDSGETWALVAETPEYNDVLSLVVDPLDSDRAYLLAGSLFMLTASSGSFRLLGSEDIGWPQLAVMPGRRVLLVASGRRGEGLYATGIPPVVNRPSRRRNRRNR